MRDPRINKLADQLVNYSTQVKPGEVALIEYEGQEAREQAVAVAEYVIKAGGIPIVEDRKVRLRRTFLKSANENQIKKLGKVLLDQMKNVQVYIGISGPANIYELNGVPKKQMDWYQQHILVPVHFKERVNKTKWCILRYPNGSMAQLSEKSTEDFEKFFFDVCTLDYNKMDKASRPLLKLMNKTDKVHIKGKDTDLTFSIKSIPGKICSGHLNIPDGECYTAPVKTSINGKVFFNCKTNDRESGTSFDSIRVIFKNGKAVEVDAGDKIKTKQLNEILDRDAGARYIGEFAIAFNPYILEPMNDILFDEKIAGSFHMAFGNAYENSDNGNRSKLHWDLVQIQRPEYGGGEIWFDGKLIRKDGKFVIPELKGLNPENLKK